MITQFNSSPRVFVVFWVPTNDNNKSKYLTRALDRAIGCIVHSKIQAFEHYEVIEFKYKKQFYTTNEIKANVFFAGDAVLRPGVNHFQRLETRDNADAFARDIAILPQGERNTLDQKGHFYIVCLHQDTALTGHPSGHKRLVDVLKDQFYAILDKAPQDAASETKTLMHDAEAEPYEDIDDLLISAEDIRDSWMEKWDNEVSVMSTCDIMDMHALLTKYYHPAIRRDKAKWNDAVIRYVNAVSDNTAVHTDAAGRKAEILYVANSRDEEGVCIFGDVLLDAVTVNYWRMTQPEGGYSNVLVFTFKYPTHEVVIEMGAKEADVGVFAPEGRSTFGRSHSGTDPKIPKRLSVLVARNSQVLEQPMSDTWIRLLENTSPADFICQVYCAFVRDSALAR